MSWSGLSLLASQLANKMHVKIFKPIFPCPSQVFTICYPLEMGASYLPCECTT